MAKIHKQKRKGLRGNNMSDVINHPCRNCRYYVYGKQHPNPNAYDEHYCERLHKPIYQHRGNAYHYGGQWIIPCGFEQSLFKRKFDGDGDDND